MNGNIRTTTNTFVLDNQSPEDVARALIENGRQKEPFFIFNMDEIYNRIELYKKMLPRVQIFYAMKVNDDNNILKLVTAAGLGFDCASPAEINKIVELNVSPQSIIFAVPYKTPEWMTFARESGVRHTTFHSSYELKKIQQYWPDACLLIRIKADGDSVHKLGDKFGCDFESGEAFELLEEAALLGLKVVGVAYHVGSICSSTDSHVTALNNARALFDYEANAGRNMNILDIGGGFGCDNIGGFIQTAKIINRKLEEMFPDSEVQIISEPGRFICESAFTLYCSINDVRRVIREGVMVNMIYLNDGPFGTLRYVESTSSVKKFKRMTDIENEKLEKTMLWGPTCSTDRIMADMEILLPRCCPLDWLVFNSHGAYSLVLGSTFSCLKVPRIRTVISREFWNKIKGNALFNDDDFILDPDISTPLPSHTPKVVKNKNYLAINYTLQV